MEGEEDAPSVTALLDRLEQSLRSGDSDSDSSSSSEVTTWVTRLGACIRHGDAGEPGVLVDRCAGLVPALVRCVQREHAADAQLACVTAKLWEALSGLPGCGHALAQHAAPFLVQQLSSPLHSARTAALVALSHVSEADASALRHVVSPESLAALMWLMEGQEGAPTEPGASPMPQTRLGYGSNACVAAEVLVMAVQRHPDAEWSPDLMATLLRLAAHAEAGSVRERGCRALRCVVLKAANQRAVSMVPGWLEHVATMLNKGDHEQQWAAAWTLSVLAIDESRRVSIRRSEVLGMLIPMLKMESLSDDVACAVLAAIRPFTLVSTDVHHLLQLNLLDALAHVEEAMEARELASSDVISLREHLTQSETALARVSMLALGLRDACIQNVTGAAVFAGTDIRDARTRDLLHWLVRRPSNKDAIPKLRVAEALTSFMHETSRNCILCITSPKLIDVWRRLLAPPCPVGALREAFKALYLIHTDESAVLRALSLSTWLELVVGFCCNLLKPTHVQEVDSNVVFGAVFTLHALASTAVQHSNRSQMLVELLQQEDTIAALTSHVLQCDVAGPLAAQVVAMLLAHEWIRVDDVNDRVSVLLDVLIGSRSYASIDQLLGALFRRWGTPQEPHEDRVTSLIRHNHVSTLVAAAEPGGSSAHAWVRLLLVRLASQLAHTNALLSAGALPLLPTVVQETPCPLTGTIMNVEPRYAGGSLHRVRCLDVGEAHNGGDGNKETLPLRPLRVHLCAQDDSLMLMDAPLKWPSSKLQAMALSRIILTSTHDGIVCFFGICEDGLRHDSHYFVYQRPTLGPWMCHGSFRMMPGDAVLPFRSKGIPPLDLRLAVVQQVAEALAWLHEHDVAHGHLCGDVVGVMKCMDAIHGVRAQLVLTPIASSWTLSQYVHPCLDVKEATPSNDILCMGILLWETYHAQSALSAVPVSASTASASHLVANCPRTKRLCAWKAAIVGCFNVPDKRCSAKQLVAVLSALAKG